MDGGCAEEEDERSGQDGSRVRKNERVECVSISLLGDTVVGVRACTN